MKERDGGFLTLSGSYKLRYGCNVPVVYYIAGSKPGQCNGPSTFPACSLIYTPSPRILPPTPPFHPVTPPRRRCIPAVGLSKVREQKSGSCLQFELSLPRVDAQDEEPASGTNPAAKHAHAPTRCGACIARRAPVTRQKLLQRTSPAGERGSFDPRDKRFLRFRRMPAARRGSTHSIDKRGGKSTFPHAGRE